MSDEEGDPILDEANRLFDQEKYQEAIALYDKLIVERKYGAEPLFMKAECLSNLNRYEEAIPWYDKAIEIDDEDAMTWNGKGNAHYHLENYAQARVCFECAYDIDPQESNYLFSIIETAILTGDFAEVVDIAREKIRRSTDITIIVFSRVFIIIALFLDHKPLNAMETIDELVKYIPDFESKPRDGSFYSTDRLFSSEEYDLCGIESFIAKRITGATNRILQALLSYLKGEIGIKKLSQAKADEFNNITLEDVLVENLPAGSSSILEEFPSFEAIIDPSERAAIERIDGLVKEFAREIGFQSFGFLLHEYDWNQDRGMAPFLNKINNRFFVDIVDGKVKRLSIDLDTLAAAILPDDHKGAVVTPQTYALVGGLFRFLHLDEFYITAQKLSDIVNAMRAASFGNGKELNLFVNVEIIPDIQEDLTSLRKIEEITEIDEYPVDYQDEGKRVVGSMIWTTGGVTDSLSRTIIEPNSSVVQAVAPHGITVVKDSKTIQHHAGGGIPLDLSDAIKVVPPGERIIWSTFIEGKHFKRAQVMPSRSLIGNLIKLVKEVAVALDDMESHFVAHALITENGVACPVKDGGVYSFHEFKSTDIGKFIRPHFDKPGFIALAGQEVLELLIVFAPDYESESEFVAKLKLFPLISYPLLINDFKAALEKMDEKALKQDKGNTRRKIHKLEADFKDLAFKHGLEVIDTSRIPIGLENLFG
nr:tetratricopeptide repeat protein [Candidatus Sigynarchaeum springense]